MKILLVEDESGMADALMAAFKSLLKRFPDARVILVGTLEAARAVLLEDPPPDLTILDLGLPGYSWQETLACVPEFESRSRVIIVTGHHEQEVRAALSLPGIEIIHKGKGMWNNIVNAIPRAMNRSKNLARIDEIIRQLKEEEANAPQ